MMHARYLDPALAAEWPGTPPTEAPALDGGALEAVAGVRGPALDGAPLAGELAAILEATPSALRVFDARGVLTRLNASAAAEHAGGPRPTTARELALRDGACRALDGGATAGEPLAPEQHPVARAMRGETVRAVPLLVQRGAPGERRVVESTATPVRDASGRLAGAVLVDRDITERARLARELGEHIQRTARLNERVSAEAEQLERMVEQRSRELLELQEARARERRLAALGQLAAGVMHDVNNALNPIMAAAYLLQRRAEDPDAVRDYAERIAKAAETCAASAARVGRFIRQEPPAEGPGQTLDLSQLADEVVDITRPLWDSGLRRGVVHVERRYAAGVVARGIAGEIREALLNLVQNAIDAMGDAGTLTVATGVTNDSDAWVEVRDTGPGMSAEVRDRAFEPFFTTKGAGGSGLGLAEVYGIMKRHRGRAEIESAPGLGTSVRLAFPLASADEEPAAAGRASPTLERRVLVVEDNPDGREFLRALLVSEGHHVDAVGDAAEARLLLGASPLGDGAAMPYDVLVTDIGLPDGNGWDVVADARRRWPAMRIGVVTGWEPRTGPSAGTADARADFTLRKPLRADELLALVGRAE
jgi:signal transduction histidine kinase/ActR/RegA family two-component response regulator